MCTGDCFSVHYDSLPSERRQLKWIKWRTGMVLLFGNIILLSIEELRGRLFRGPGKRMKIYKEGDRWEEHEMSMSNVYGVDISVSSIHVGYCTYIHMYLCISMYTVSTLP